MDTNKIKTNENRLRRAAKRQGLELVKATSTPPQWLLVDPATGKIVSGLLLLTFEEMGTFLTPAAPNKSGRPRAGETAGGMAHGEETP